MDFSWSEDQRAYQQLARDFAEAELAPHAARWDAESIFPVDVIKKAGSLGFCSIYCRPERGGMGLKRLDASIIFQELASGCTPTAAFLTIHNMVTWMVTEFGSDALCAQWAPALTTGEKLASYCLTEAGAGSDAASLKTRAVSDGDEYVINGSKQFISGAGATDVLVVMARTSDNGAAGVSSFLVPADAPGVSYGNNEEKMGWHAQPTAEIIFQDVRIPKGNRLGNEGDGFKFAMRGLDGGRINIASCSLGVAPAALNLAQPYMNERQQFGKTLAGFQALQFKLADMATHLVASRLMVHNAADKLDKGDPNASVYCAMAKRLATDLCFDVCNEALQIHGGYGYLRDFPLERQVRDARVHQILEGTNEIMRVIVARKLLLEGMTDMLR